MKFLSTADIHYHKDYLKSFRKSATFFLQTALAEKPDCIILAGDTADRVINNSESAAMPELLDFITELLNIAPVFTVEGTKSHDIPGSLELFARFATEYPFIILQPGEVSYLMESGSVETHLALDMFEYATGRGSINPIAAIYGIPEPNKSWLIANDQEGRLSGDEAREAASKGLAALFSMISASVSKQDIPTIGVFHGTVRGSKISETQTLPEGSIDVTAQMLASVGFDYVACGHIHMRQELAPNVWYEGSFFPKTWGEKDQKAFSIVKITDEHTFRTQVNFPHPPMIKLNRHFDEVNLITSHDVKGKRVWLEVSIEANRRTELDTNSILLWLMAEWGAVEDSRVSAKIINTETARAPEIATNRDLVEKFRIWHESSTGLQDISPLNLEQIGEVKEMIRKEGFEHQSKRLRLDYFFARGAIGFIKGQDKEEVTVDFNDFSAGTIALLGENGAGKSTFIKLCAPYASPLDPNCTKMQDLFYLRDSKCIKEFTDTVSGVRYQTIWLINGKAATGKAEFFLNIQHPGSEWEPINSEVTGLKTPYEAAVVQIFGSPEMYSRSVYIAQGNVDLPATPKGRKELFNELMGNEYLQKAYEFAKKKADELEAQIEKAKLSISTLQELIDNGSSKVDLQVIAANNETLIEGHKADLETINTMKETLEKFIKVIDERRLKNTAIDKEILPYLDNIDEYTAKSDRAKDSIEEGRVLLKKLPNSKLDIIEYEQLKEKLDKKTDEKVLIDSANNIKAAAYNKLLTTYNRLDADVQNATRANNKVIDDLNATIKSENGLISSNETTIEMIKDPCEKCGHIQTSTQKRISEIEYKNNVSKRIISDSKCGLIVAETQKNFLEKDLEKLIEPKEPELDKVEELIEAIESLKRRVSNFTPDYDRAKEVVSDCAAVESNIAIYLKNITEYEKKISDLQVKYKLAIDGIVPINPADEENYGKLSDVNLDIENVNRIIRNLELQSKSVEEKIANLDNLLLQVSDKKEAIQASVDIVASWKLVQRGLSRDGIQALELDALAPAIADEANILLQEAYGSRFSLRFQTTKEVGSGANLHQSEDFEIIITDNDLDVEDLSNEQKLSTNSGGEKVWINKALYDAFGIIRERNTGLSYVTNFQDEADGALSPENKHLYLNMVEKAHQAAGRHHTILITHDLVIQASVPQQIVFKK